MKRHALIISCPGEQDDDEFLPGAEIDAESWEDYLLSDRGGAWETSEITTLVNPSLFEARLRLAYTHAYDFTFVAFSGHGAHPEDDDDEMSSFVSLADDELMCVNDLVPDSERGILLVDACRRVHPPGPEREKLAKGIRLEGLGGAYRDQCRAMYDVLAMSASPQVNVGFSCSINEVAGEKEPDGGFFTHTMIAEAQEWRAITRLSSLTFNAVFDGAAGSLRTRFRTARQTPKRNRYRGKSLPFAVAP